MKKIKIALMSLVAIFAANLFADVVNLNSLTGNKVIKNNASVIGELRRGNGRINDRKLSIANGATIYLSDAKINDDWSIRLMEEDTVDKVFSYPGLTCEGDATIVLEGDNIVNALGDENLPGIYVPAGHTLTIKGNGTLKVAGNDYAAAIGGGEGIGNGSCGNIIIEGGTIDATSERAPAIGACGSNSNCGEIIFDRCNVTAKAYNRETFPPFQPVIGASYFGTCPKITIKETIGMLDLISFNAGSSTEAFTEDGHTGVVNSTGEYDIPKDWGLKCVKVNQKGIVGGDTIAEYKITSQLGRSGKKTYKNTTGVPSLIGALSGDYKISIADDASIDLHNVTIGPTLRDPKPGITCEGDATITLYGTNYVYGCGEDWPAIFVPEGHMLTIKGNGTLIATCGGNYATAIGGCRPRIEGKAGGKVLIQADCGNIMAIGGKYASALGNVFKNDDGELVVNGDKVIIRSGEVRTKAGVKIYEEASNDPELSDQIELRDGIELVDSEEKGVKEFFAWNGDLTAAGAMVDFIARDKMTIYGKSSVSANITINPGATVTLRDVQADTDNKGVLKPLFLKCKGDAVIELEGDNILKGREQYPAIEITEGHTLTIRGEGSLRAISGNDSADRGVPGIGGSNLNQNCGNIVIENGVITAQSSTRQHPAIGAYAKGECGKIKFKGGCTTLLVDGLWSDSMYGRQSEKYDGLEIGPGMGSRRTQEEIVQWENGQPVVVGYMQKEVFAWNGKLKEIIEEEENGGKKKAMKAVATRDASDPAPDEYSLPLKNVISEAIAGDGTVITGTLSGLHKISIAHGATVTLRDAEIVQGHDDSSAYAGITCLGDATIKLEGRNYIWAFHAYYPAISVPQGSTLTIEGNGVLYADGGAFGAGIGGGYDIDCGKIVINGGEIHADGGLGAAGIGGGAKASAGAIVLNGGTIEATSSTPVGTYSEASGIKYVGSAPGVGVGWSGSGDSIYINSGVAKVTAKRGNAYSDYIGAGAGGTIDRIEVPVTISGALKATDENNTRTLQWDGDLGNVDESDWSVVALDDTTIRGQLSGRTKILIAPDSGVTLNGATIGSVSASDNDAYKHAGITCLGDAKITLKNSNKVYGIYSTCPGIFVPKGAMLTIEGEGTLEAESNGSGAGIGGANGVDCGKIVISGGEVTARGRGGSAAIGAGSGASCDGVRIDSTVTTVYAQSADVDNYDKLVGAGTDGTCSETEIGPGLVVGDSTSGLAKMRRYSHGSVDLSTIETGFNVGEYVIQDGQTITGTLSTYRKLVIAHGATVKLSNATINSEDWTGVSYAGLTCAGDATIILYGENSINSYDGKYPGIYVPSGNTLTIKGEGSLNVSGGHGEGCGGAGIGAGYDELPCGSIFIEGGVITATGHGGAAGIGGGFSESATSGAIRISGGADVTATGGTGASGIGAGVSGNCGYVWIDGDITKVVATRGLGNSDQINAIGYGAAGTIINTTVGVYLHPSLLRTDEDKTATVVVNPGIELSKLEYKYETTTICKAKDGGVISGKLPSTYNYKIVIADGATVTLDNVTIEGINNGLFEFAGITCEGDATIILVGENRVVGFLSKYPGIYVPAGKTLTIKGSGSLYAGTQGQGAGIGAGYKMDCGNIVIESGTIFASGRPRDEFVLALSGGCGAGIGGSDKAVCGDITIKGGRVDAIGAGAAAGIGGACEGKGCGDITILGGVVEALGGDVLSASIGAGGGSKGSCGTITIDSEVQSVVASARCIDPDDPEIIKYPPIGACPEGEQATISISGALLDSTYSENFGSEDKRWTRALVNKRLDLGTIDKDKVDIYDGMTVTGTLNFPAKLVIPVGAHVTLNNATINFEDGNSQNYQWAGLTCVGDATITLKGDNTVCGFFADYPGIHIPQGCVLTIDGSGSLSAFSNGWASGIGGGFDLSCGDIVINGGTINAQGGSYAAGIGGGAYKDCGAIIINGGNVTSFGGGRAAGIGGGLDAKCGKITIGAGVSCVRATRGDGGNEASEPIGRGDYNGDESDSACDGVEADLSLTDTTSADGMTRTIKSRFVNLSSLKEDCTLQDQEVATGTLTGAYKISITAGATVTLRDADINGSGNYTSSESEWAGITCNGDATIILEGENAVTGFNVKYPGIYVPSGSTLTIRGEGSLAASALKSTGYSGAAGIGGGYLAERSAGNIVIESGTIVAKGGTGQSACIGGGYNSTCGDITIGEDIASVTCSSANGSPYNGAQYIGKGAGVDAGCGDVKIHSSLEQKTVSGTGLLVALPWDGNLATFDADGMIVADGTSITGTIEGDKTIKVAAGATVTLCNAYIEGQLDCSAGGATIILVGTSRIIAPTGKFAVNGSISYICTVQGSGTLIAYCDETYWLYGLFSLKDGLESTKENNVFIIAQSPTKEFDAWMSANGISSSDWDNKDANGVPNALKFITAPETQAEEEALEDGIIQGITIEEDGSITLETPELRNTAGFDIKVIASDDPAGIENVEEYSLSEIGVTSIEEEGETTKRFFKVVIEKK